jgi:hypothetical protein
MEIVLGIIGAMIVTYGFFYVTNAQHVKSKKRHFPTIAILNQISDNFDGHIKNHFSLEPLTSFIGKFNGHKFEMKFIYSNNNLSLRGEPKYLEFKLFLKTKSNVSLRMYSTKPEMVICGKIVEFDGLDNLFFLSYSPEYTNEFLSNVSNRDFIKQLIIKEWEVTLTKNRILLLTSNVEPNIDRSVVKQNLKLMIELSSRL